jgi:hypothetical protein
MRPFFICGLWMEILAGDLSRLCVVIVYGRAEATPLHNPAGFVTWQRFNLDGMSLCSTR